MKDFIRRCICSLILVIAVSGAVLFTDIISHAATPKPSAPVHEDFPIYPEIKPNVDFWIDIFTKYSRAQGVVHDVRDLSKVYGVIKLNPVNTRRAAKANRKVKEKALKQYKATLLKLAKGKTPSTKQEKKVAALFGPNPKADKFKQAAYRLRVQTGIKKHFMEGVIRSGAYLEEFKRIFRSYGLPEDIVYLPCVESSFNVAAYSKFGAAGVWQFTRGTGKQYMDIGYVVDERRDPFIATHGAAKLLKKNYGALKNWPMALTAYNHGLNGMKRAKKKHKTYPNIYKYYRSRSFKFASRNFYSEFLAAKQVAKNYTHYYGKIVLDRPVSYTRYTVKGYVPAVDLARDLNLNIKTLQAMNPALRKPVFDGRKYIPKGFEIKLPQKVGLDTVSQTAASLYRKKQKPSKFHRVQKGDTAGSIARTHKVPLKDLIMANGLGRRATIYIGQTLRIPGTEERIPVKTAIAKADTAKPAKKIKPPPKNEEKVPPKKQELTASIPKKEEPKKVVVKESPAAPPVESIQEKPKTVTDKQVPDAEIQAKPVPAAPQTNLRIVTADLKIQKTVQNGKTGIIHVAPEETLGHYADWLGIATQKIRNLNKLRFGRAISIGQNIKIPSPQDGFEHFEEQRYEFHQEILEDFFDSFFVSGTQTYEVKSGDTVWLLCINELEIPLWLLQKYNPTVDFNKLQPGQTLIYPLLTPTGNLPDALQSPHNGM
ncbi:MAG: LysM peptidoglycan-binding domain-containing protein [Desulfobacterales bacterium]|nr:LysM peptidoglycan-binding domain-containing protein [Desulfobacterales bacterium]